MIFISHAREDAVFARALALTLEAEGHAVWIDPPLLQGDAFWRQRLARRLEACDTMIAIESPAAAASPWVQQERFSFGGALRSVVAPPAMAGDVRLAAAAGKRAAEPGEEWATEWPTGRRVERPAGPTAGLNAELTADLAAESAGELAAVSAASRPRAWAAERLALAARQQAWLQAVLARPAPRAEFDGDRAWLAGGRIELRRVPGGAYVATAPLTNALYREFVAAMAGEVPPPPTWTDPEFAAAFAGDAQAATAMTWFEAAACAHRFGATLPGEAERAGLAAAVGATWDWCRDRWRPEDASPLAHRVIAGGGACGSGSGSGIGIGIGVGVGVGSSSSSGSGSGSGIGLGSGSGSGSGIGIGIGSGVGVGVGVGVGDGDGDGDGDGVGTDTGTGDGTGDGDGGLGLGVGLGRGASPAPSAGPGTPPLLRYRNAPIDRDCCVGLRLALPPPAHAHRMPAR